MADLHVIAPLRCTKFTQRHHAPQDAERLGQRVVHAGQYVSLDVQTP